MAKEFEKLADLEKVRPVDVKRFNRHLKKAEKNFYVAHKKFEKEVSQSVSSAIKNFLNDAEIKLPVATSKKMIANATEEMALLLLTDDKRIKNAFTKLANNVYETIKGGPNRTSKPITKKTAVTKDTIRKAKTKTKTTAAKKAVARTR